MKRLLLLCLLASPLFGAYTTCRKLTIDHTQAGTADSANFVFLFSATQADSLNGAINNSVTTITVTKGTFIFTGDYIQIDSEIMLVTAGGLTTSLTVTRAQKSTSAASHSSGAIVADLFLGTTGNAGLATSASGFDIVLFSDACVTKIPFERPFYDATGATSEFWANIGTLSHTVDTAVYVGVGNAAVTTDQAVSASSVYPARYKSVWHMQTGGTNGGTMVDSLGNSNGACTGPAAFTNPTNRINGNYSMLAGGPGNGGQCDVGKLPLTYDGSNTQWAVSLWYYLQSAGNGWIMGPVNTGSTRILVRGDNTSNGFAIQYCTTFGCPTNSQQAQINFGSFGGGWTYITLVIDMATNANCALYFNGVLQGSSTCSTTGTPGTVLPVQTSDISVGQYATSGIFGQMDELRSANTAPTASWVLAEYNNQVQGSTFFSVSDQPQLTFVPQIGGFLVQ